MKVIIFENDGDFEMFAVKNKPYVKHEGSCSYVDWDFSDEYLEEVSNGTEFYIKDRNSKIAKRHACVCGIIAKPVTNIFYYNDALADIWDSSVVIEDFSEKHNDINENN